MKAVYSDASTVYIHPLILYFIFVHQRILMLDLGHKLAKTTYSGINLKASKFSEIILKNHITYVVLLAACIIYRKTGIHVRTLDRLLKFLIKSLTEDIILR